MPLGRNILALVSHDSSCRALPNSPRCFPCLHVPIRSVTAYLWPTEGASDPSWLPSVCTVPGGRSLRAAVTLLPFSAIYKDRGSASPAPTASRYVAHSCSRGAKGGGEMWEAIGRYNETLGYYSVTTRPGSVLTIVGEHRSLVTLIANIDRLAPVVVLAGNRASSKR